MGYFNSRPSARGDEVGADYLAEKRLFQFTPLREGRPKTMCDNSRLSNISIHAPPRGATSRMFRPKTPLCLISIHAPPRGATIALADFYGVSLV